MAILKNTTIDSTEALQLPVGTTAQRPESPLIGMLRYNSNTKYVEYYDGTTWKNTTTVPDYESLTYVVSGNLTITGNGTDSVNIFKTSGSNSWDNQAYSTTPFTAPCTIEFNKEAGATDNGASYAMIAWNTDPTTNASYASLDHASYPYQTNGYVVYNNGAGITPGTTWSTANKFYLVYGTDGTIKHYNGSTLVYSANYGTGLTVYVDSSFYSPNATYGGFSNIKVIKAAWNGTTYV